LVFELKLLSKDGIPGALAKGERYRLLGEPWEAENIYLDILQVDPESQPALVGLVLALTDQFGQSRSASVARAREALAQIRDDYERAYYAGIICERRARALLDQDRPGAGGAVYEQLREAMRWYEEAEARRPAGNDDAILRWNACTRLLRGHPELIPAAEERQQPYVDH
jgi:hypothetical protein